MMKEFCIKMIRQYQRICASDVDMQVCAEMFSTLSMPLQNTVLCAVFCSAAGVFCGAILFVKAVMILFLSEIQFQAMNLDL